MLNVQQPYPFLIRRAGRGRTVTHLADSRGEAMCGLALGERWELARSTTRRVCRRCQRLAGGNANAATVTPITRTRGSGASRSVNKPTAQDLIDQVAEEMYAIARELGERSFFEAPSDSRAWHLSARKVIRVWRQRQQGGAGLSSKGAAVSRRR